MDTLQFRFAQSALFNGAGDYLSSPDTNDAFFGSGDFSIDFWIMFNTLSASSDQVIYSQFQSGSDFFLISKSANTWNFAVMSAGVPIIGLIVNSSTSTNTWTHMALVRNGNSFQLFENGTQIGSVTDADDIPNFASPLYIGTSGSSLFLDGYIDEFRISNIARWTENFVPPTVPYDLPIPTATSTPTATLTFTPTFTPSITSTGTLPTSTPTLVKTPTPIVIAVTVVTVPAVITLNNDNTNKNQPGGGSGSGSSSSGTSTGSGSFHVTTPIPWQGQGGASVFGGYSCGGFYIRVRVFVDDNEDKLMSPAEGVTGLQVFLLDQSYSRIGNSYTIDGLASFCIPATQYGKTMMIDIPYLQQFASLQIADNPTEDQEIWFPGQAPLLPLFLP
jgi:hypothetical protein